AETNARTFLSFWTRQTYHFQARPHISASNSSFLSGHLTCLKKIRPCCSTRGRTWARKVVCSESRRRGWTREGVRLGRSPGVGAAGGPGGGGGLPNRRGHFAGGGHWAATGVGPAQAMMPGFCWKFEGGGG